MKISFPYMGPVLAYKKLFEKLGHEVIVPLRPTRKTIELGTKYSPEFICFPFKIILGSYLEALELGAEAFITTGFIGACRAVYYGNLCERILQELGFNIRVFVFDSPAEDFTGFIRQCRELGKGKSFLEALSSLSLAVRLIYATDFYQKKINHLRPYEINPGVCNRIWLEIQGLLDSCNKLRKMPSVLREADKLISGIPIEKERAILKVGLVGEICFVMESHANNDIEEKLARLGVEVVRNQYISHWLNHSLFSSHHLTRQADRYLKYCVGGHEKINIGYILKYKKMGFDGIIHLMPFACMPELVTQTIIPPLSAELDLPILSLSLDEQTGWVNNTIRIETFVELLWARREMAKEGCVNGEAICRY